MRTICVECVNVCACTAMLLSYLIKRTMAWMLCVCVRVGCQVADPEKYHFRPKEMLVQVVETVLNLAPHDEFITAVVESDLVNEESTWCRGCVAVPVGQADGGAMSCFSFE